MAQPVEKKKSGTGEPPAAGPAGGAGQPSACGAGQPSLARPPAAAGQPSAPGRPSAAERRHQATEQRILAAARELLLARTTIEGLSLREVARRADFTPGALYRYFADRDELLRALFMGALDVFTAHMEEAAAAVADRPAAERLTALGLAYLSYAREHPQDLVMVFEAAAPTPSWDAYVQVARPFTLVVAAAREGVERGELIVPEGLDAPRLAYTFWALVHGMAVLEGAHLSNVRGELAATHELAIRHVIASFTPEFVPNRGAAADSVGDGSPPDPAAAAAAPNPGAADPSTLPRSPRSAS
jgi:AcrR family transcriptional regulator